MLVIQHISTLFYCSPVDWKIMTTWISKLFGFSDFLNSKSQQETEQKGGAGDISFPSGLLHGIVMIFFKSKAHATM